MIRSGSLFSGIGGLDIAVNEYYNSETAWFCDSDKHCQQILHHHYPDIPIVPDIREIDASIGQIDILHGGYPCQPFSAAGQKKGLEDERDMWPEYARVIDTLRPKIVIGENVEGHLRRGFEWTLRDFFKMGYDVRWGVVRASDTGAPHKRARLFFIATDASLKGAWWDSGKKFRAEEYTGRGKQSNSYSFKHFSEIVSDSDRKRFDRWRERNSEGRWAWTKGSGKVTADTYRERQSWDTFPDEGVARSVEFEDMGEEIFGQYAFAVRRWEYLTQACCPYPVDEKSRLNPDFVEWMMGYPVGYTDGLARTNKLKVLGNSVVPQQAYLALELLNEVE